MKTNTLGQPVIATGTYYYSLLNANESFRCCGEYQWAEYCFENNTKQGCSYCEYDAYAPCQCELCEK